MREKIRLTDLTVLYVCLSRNWGTLERRSLADAIYFRNIGGTPYIACLSKSILETEAIKQDIPTLTFPAELLTWRSQLNFYFQIQQILSKHQFDLFHTYNASTLLPLGGALKGLARIPLIFTFDEFILPRNISLLDQWYMSRTDLILTFTENLKELAGQSFPVSFRKIHCIGTGIEFPLRLSHSKTSVERKRIFTFISRSLSELDQLKFLMTCIQPILYQLEQKEFKKKILFTFLTDIPWYVHPLYESLKRMVLERRLEMFINFETRPLAFSSFEDCDIYMGLPGAEPFLDIDLYALLSHTPVLIPRTSSRGQLVKQGKFGETYHPEDGREFKDKFLKIILNLSNYMDDLRGGENELIDKHNFERYSEELYAHYERLCAKRLRYSLQKKKLA